MRKAIQVLSGSPLSSPAAGSLVCASIIDEAQLAEHCNALHGGLRQHKTLHQLSRCIHTHQSSTMRVSAAATMTQKSFLWKRYIIIRCVAALDNWRACQNKMSHGGFVCAETIFSALCQCVRGSSLINNRLREIKKTRGAHRVADERGKKQRAQANATAWRNLVL